METASTDSPSTRSQHRNAARNPRHAGSRVSAGTTGRRRACNECRQQKLRCDLAEEQQGTPVDVCSRCDRLGLDCKIEDGFRRTRKRRRSADLDDEILDLRKQLAEARSANTLRQPGPNSTTDLGEWPIPCATVESDPTFQSSVQEGADTQTPGLTTRPDSDELLPRRPTSVLVPGAKSLGSTWLAVDSVAGLYQEYRTSYHTFLPCINISRTPDYHYQQSKLLFWTIMAIGSRRLTTQPTLLTKLARDVTNLLWATIRSVPHSLGTVQALILLCAWPFPISSSTKDSTFMLVGVMLQLATQMGLHRAVAAQDFSKAPTRLSSEEYDEWVRTWEACNIVSQSVSVGCGLPLSIPTGVFTTETTTTPGTSYLRSRLLIEQFRQSVSSSLDIESGDKLDLYRLLNAELGHLETQRGVQTPSIDWYLVSARLHLQAYYLFDQASSAGYNDRILELYETAIAVIDQTLRLEDTGGGFLSYCPFFCSQVFVCAAFIVLKISTNGFFRLIINIESGTQQLELAIAALRKMSVVNNDIPARLGDVLAFFCALPNPALVGGHSIEDIRLKQVNTRLSMSIVHDFLRTWRSHFRSRNHETSVNTDGGNINSFSSDFEDMVGFNFPIDMGNFLDMDMSF